MMVPNGVARTVIALIGAWTTLGCEEASIAKPANSNARTDLDSGGQEDNAKLPLKDGAIGLVRLHSEGETGFKVQIIFPEKMVTEKRLRGKESIRLMHDLWFFDHLGVLGRISLLSARESRMDPVYWCINDGGSHYRPQMSLEFSEKLFERAPEENPKTDGISYFVYHGDSIERAAPVTEPPVYTTWRYDKEEGLVDQEAVAEILLEGAMTSEGTSGLIAIARIIEIETESGCGRRLAEDSLELQTAEGRFELRCCGP